MSTDSLMGKSPRSIISAYSLVGKYLGYNMYVLFALLIIYQKHIVDFYITHIQQRRGAIFFGADDNSK